MSSFLFSVVYVGSRLEETSEIARSRRLTETTASDCPAIFRLLAFFACHRWLRGWHRLKSKWLWNVVIIKTMYFSPRTHSPFHFNSNIVCSFVFFFYHFNFVFVWLKSEKRGCFIVKHFKLMMLMSKIQNSSSKTLAAALVDMFVSVSHLHKPQTIPRPFTGYIFHFFLPSGSC